MKYYYDDPLKMAWMSREFGVKIYKGNEIFHEILQDKHTGANIIKRYLVHPDSYGIFEPKVGDLVDIFGVGEPLHIVRIDKYRVYFNKGSNSSINKVKIIRRNVKAFFLPELSTTPVEGEGRE